MPKAQIAEFILSLFTTRERAASTVGDLMESAPARGARWFWSSVSRTALSLFWESFAAEPAFMMRIGFRGLLLNMGLLLGMLLGIVILTAIFGIVFAVVVASHSAPGTLPYSWVFSLMGWIAAFAVQFQTGRWIARRARDREMAACMAFLIVQAIVMPVIGELLLGWHWLASLANAPGAATAPDTTVGSLILSTLAGVVPLFAGAIWVRRRIAGAQPFPG